MCRTVTRFEFVDRLLLLRLTVYAMWPSGVSVKIYWLPAPGLVASVGLISLAKSGNRQCHVTSLLGRK